jgi:hypothetical protein
MDILLEMRSRGEHGVKVEKLSGGFTKENRGAAIVPGMLTKGTPR